jgi:Peptidase M15
MITIADYLMGRDREFGHLLSVAMRTEALRTCELASKLMVIAKLAGVAFEPNPRTGTVVSSGWRPPAVNEATPGAALRSKHLSCQAIDIFDPAGDMDEWLLLPDGQRALTDLGLWQEHPSATKGWAHVQTLPPRSGRRTFYP